MPHNVSLQSAIASSVYLMRNKAFVAVVNNGNTESICEEIQTRTHSLLLSALWFMGRFDEFAVHQGKEGGKLRSFCPPPSQKALRTLIAFPYSNTKRNK